jgi:hypothetical protein
MGFHEQIYLLIKGLVQAVSEIGLNDQAHHVVPGKQKALLEECFSEVGECLGQAGSGGVFPWIGGDKIKPELDLGFSVHDPELEHEVFKDFR